MNEVEKNIKSINEGYNQEPQASIVDHLNKKVEPVSQIDDFLRRSTENYNAALEGTSYVEYLEKGKGASVESIKSLRDKSLNTDATSENKPKQ